MEIKKGTKSFLSNLGHYIFFYMSDKIVEFNRDCEVEVKPFINTGNTSYIAVQTRAKNIGIYEESSNDEDRVIVWISK